MSLKLRLRNRQTIAYGGVWNYTDPHSGQHFSFYLFDGLVERIRAHRIANNFPVGLEFEQEIEDQLCLNHPDECSHVPEGMPVRTRLSLNDVLNGTRVMMQFYAKGKPLVSHAEAEARAETCSKCPLNIDFSKPCSMGICGELKQLVDSIIDHKQTKYDSQLRSCQICGCYLSAAVHLPLDVQCVGVTEKMKTYFEFAKQQSRCWKQCA